MRAFKTTLLATALLGGTGGLAKAEFYVSPFAGMLVTVTTADIGTQRAHILI